MPLPIKSLIPRNPPATSEASAGVEACSVSAAESSVTVAAEVTWDRSRCWCRCFSPWLSMEPVSEPEWA